MNSIAAVSPPHQVIMRSLAIVGWIGLAVGAVVGVVLESRTEGPPNELALTLSMAMFYLLLLGRLFTAMSAYPERRAALASLTAAITLWAAGSASVNSLIHSGVPHFPSPGEVLFLTAYIAFAAFVRFDAGHRRGGRATPWLDALIVCGGAGALAAALLLTPFVAAFPEGGVPLMVALIYPVLDVVLALIVVGQWALASRSMTRRELALIAGFLIMALADSSLVLKLSTGPYAFTITLIILWGLALMLIVGSACTARPPQASLARRLPASFLAASFLLAIILLVARPEGTVGMAIAIPAVVTLLATSARLIIALRESRAASENYRLAVTDDLTGLPNRRALLKELDERIASAEPLSLLLLDLDGFKEVNDTLGHSAGDTLLELIALRIRESLPASLMFARVGGDEFAVIYATEDEIELLEQAATIRQTLLARARIDGLDLAVDASMGIAVREEGDAQAVDILRRADVAMYEAKTTRTGAQIYNVDRDEFSRARLQMGDELRRALQRGQIRTWYQPKVDAATARIIGVEALVRWEHPERGVLSPLAFLPVARRVGLMQQLSEAIVKQAISDAAAWHREGLELNVAINVAPPELLSGALMPVVYRALERSPVPLDGITIEVTEDTFINDPEHARDLLIDIRRHGLRTSIDDYGTGFSSLAYLRDLPLSELKMDRSFVSSVLTDPRSRTIVESTINMAHALDLHVVAEGVESQEVADAVTSLGVDVLQGYFIAPPMRAFDVADWAADWNRPAMRVVGRADGPSA
ncbi:MAG: EAL domain-containing protein [Actinomycetota bacterium]|nr:EAL domain-containing protein [Actinomycetota bacterium]